MPKLKMTDMAIRKTMVRPGERVDFFDAHPRDRQRGLVLRISASGTAGEEPRITRTWAVMCRVKGSAKLRRFAVGEYPACGLAQARERAEEIRRDAGRGIDPLVERRATEERKREADKDTVAAVAERFLQNGKTKTGKNWSARHKDGTRRNLENHVLPRWADRPIGGISRRDFGDLLDEIAKKGTIVKDEKGKRHVPGGEIAANRVRALVRRLFGFAVSRGIIESAPTTNIELRGQETKRKRVLHADEIREVWTQFEARAYPFGMWDQIALLTGQRRDEVARMRWSGINETDRTWTLRTKGDKPQNVPLSNMAIEILAQARKAGEKLAKAKEKRPSEYVFSTTITTPISGFSGAKEKLDGLIAAARKSKGLPPMEHWTFHDLRRTCSTELGKLGVPDHVIDRVLNHAAKTVADQHYNQHDYLPEKRHALDAWAARLAEIVGSAPAPMNVVPMRSRRDCATQQVSS